MVGLAAVHPARARELGRRGWPELTNTAGPAGGGGAEGRAAVTGCEPLASGGGGSGAGWLALVWCNSGLVGGISRCAGLLLVGWRAVEVVTRLSHVARNMVGRRGIRWDDWCRSVGGEGRAGTSEHGFSLTGGQVVAGSNPVSPTAFRQVKCYLYLLPKLASLVHLIWCLRRPGIAVCLPGPKPALTCVFCPESDARMAATSSRRVVTRESVDGGRASRSHAETSR